MGCLRMTRDKVPSVNRTVYDTTRFAFWLAPPYSRSSNAENTTKGKSNRKENGFPLPPIWQRIIGSLSNVLISRLP